MAESMSAVTAREEKLENDRFDVPQAAMVVTGLSAAFWIAIIAAFNWLF